MPGFDKTGPEGKGPRTGRGEGICGTDKTKDDVKQSTAENKEEIWGLGRGGRPRGGGRGRGYGGGRRRRGMPNRGGRNENRADEVN